ncbi:hypothetical protein [Enterovibrio norvegicus]|uniref:hypothetical protein n=1 Tax=Enterovibrio norvegicus TaxID=188144 RepID=UPI00355264B8
MQVTAAVSVTLDANTTKQVTLNRLSQVLGFSDYQSLTRSGLMLLDETLMVEDGDYHSTWNKVHRPATELDKAVLVVMKGMNNG